MLKIIWRFFNNPFVGLLLGIGVTIFFFLLDKKEYVIGYKVDNQNLVATNQVDSNITILFKGDTLNNINIVQVGFWNDGGAYLDKAAISSSEPLRIISDSAIKILNYKLIQKSRSNLHFEVQTAADLHSLVLLISGDDGLEKFDGARLQIIYSGSVGANWKPTGRIKGNLNSFINYTSENFARFKMERSYFYFILCLFFFPLFFIIFLSYMVQLKKVELEGISSYIIMYGLPFLLMVVATRKLWLFYFYNGHLNWWT